MLDFSKGKLLNKIQHTSGGKVKEIGGQAFLHFSRLFQSLFPLFLWPTITLVLNTCGFDPSLDKSVQKIKQNYCQVSLFYILTPIIVG